MGKASCPQKLSPKKTMGKLAKQDHHSHGKWPINGVFEQFAKAVRQHLWLYNPPVQLSVQHTGTYHHSILKHLRMWLTETNPVCDRHVRHDDKSDTKSSIPTLWESSVLPCLGTTTMHSTVNCSGRNKEIQLQLLQSFYSSLDSVWDYLGEPVPIR